MEADELLLRNKCCDRGEKLEKNPFDRQLSTNDIFFISTVYNSPTNMLSIHSSLMKQFVFA